MFLRLILIVVLFITYSGFFVSPVFAHVLKTDGNIGAVVHIDPEDDPIVGEQTNIYFEVKDKSGQFKIENCDCTFVVKKEGSEVYSQMLTQTVGIYSFPERNVYTIELRGKPKVDGQFQPFTLSYDIRVDRERDRIGMVETNRNNGWTFRDWSIFGGIIVGIIVMVVLFIFRRKVKL